MNDSVTLLIRHQVRADAIPVGEAWRAVIVCLMAYVIMPRHTRPVSTWLFH